MASLEQLSARALAASLSADGPLDEAALSGRLEHALATLPPHCLYQLLPELDFRAHCAMRILAARKPAVAALLAAHAQELDVQFRSSALELQERGRVTLGTHHRGAAPQVDRRLLIDLHEHPELLVRSPQPPAEQTLISPPEPAPPAPPLGALSVVSQAQFEENFRVSTMDQLAGLDWRNVLAAGGVVEACATLQPPPRGARDRMLTELLLRDANVLQQHAELTQSPAFLALHAPDSKHARSDVDLYIYGLNPSETRAKIFEVVTALRAGAEARGATLYVMQTRHAFTCFTEFPFRVIQIIIACYSCVSHVFLDFDLACCCVGTRDGKSVIALPTALLALNTRSCVLPASNRSLAVGRLQKYAERGYACTPPERCFIDICDITAADVATSCVVDAQHAEQLMRWGKMQASGGCYAVTRYESRSSRTWWIRGVTVQFTLVNMPVRFQLWQNSDPADDTYAAANELSVNALLQQVYVLPDERQQDDQTMHANVLDKGFYAHELEDAGEDDWQMLSGPVLPYGPPCDADGHHVDTSRSSQSTANMIRAARPDWALAKTLRRMRALTISADVREPAFAQQANGRGALAFKFALQAAEHAFAAPKAALWPPRLAAPPVRVEVTLLSCEWRLELSMLRDEHFVREEDTTDAGMLVSLTLLRVADPDPLLRSSLTPLWKAPDGAAEDVHDMQSYRLLATNISFEVLNACGDASKIMLDDHYTFPFITYDADGVGQHVNGPAVAVPQLTLPDVAFVGSGVQAPGAQPLTPSRTWRNQIHWYHIQPHENAAQGAAVAALTADDQRRHAGFFDADGNLRLRLRLQVGRLERTRDITPFPRAAPRT